MDRRRIERDSMGEIEVPIDALWGAQTQRAVDNFGICDRTMPGSFLRSLALVKSVAAGSNAHHGVLDEEIAVAIQRAADAVAGGAHADAFPVSVFQTGSGTSSNMNMNEVLASLATRDSGHQVHPNDHVNASQSSNDVVPTSIQVAAAVDLNNALLPALQALIDAVERRAGELSNTVKTGRTHLMDAMPLTFGQEFSAWSHQLRECVDRFDALRPRLHELPIGGSAVGTGVNVPAGFADDVAQRLGERVSLDLRASPNPFARMAGQDVAAECSSHLRGLAVVLAKINNDLRWMASGPLAGIAEIELQALQPGSSIMPGKVNPVLPEAVLMATTEVMGNDVAIGIAAQSGNFQLNVMLPLIADRLIGGIALLSGACRATAQTVSGFKVNHDNVQTTLARNPVLVTALNSRIGYDAAAAIAKRAYAEKRPIIDVAAEDTDIPREQLERLLDPAGLTGAT